MLKESYLYVQQDAQVAYLYENNILNQIVLISN